MEREIKFRGLSTETGEWEYGFLIKTINPHKIENEYWAAFIHNGVSISEPKKILPDSVGQFTGLHDKEGNEIYEGDIVRRGDDTLTVTWNKKFASFCLDKNGWMHSHYFGEAADPSQVEIIGNIHLHPELLTNK